MAACPRHQNRCCPLLSSPSPARSAAAAIFFLPVAFFLLSSQPWLPQQPWLQQKLMNSAATKLPAAADFINSDEFIKLCSKPLPAPPSSLTSTASAATEPIAPVFTSHGNATAVTTTITAGDDFVAAHFFLLAGENPSPASAAKKLPAALCSSLTPAKLNASFFFSVANPYYMLPSNS